MPRHLGRRVGVAMLGLAVLIQLARPARTNPVTDPSRTMAAHLQVTPAASVVMDRACRDCHSNDTRWPWYSNVAPISWFVIDHVNSGRRHFNYSDWLQNDPDRTPRLLKDICDLTHKGDMPMSSYLWMHSDARVSDRDVNELCGWVQSVSKFQSSKVPKFQGVTLEFADAFEPRSPCRRLPVSERRDRLESAE